MVSLSLAVGELLFDLHRLICCFLWQFVLFSVLFNTLTSAGLNPLPSDRQRLSYDVCLVVRGEIIGTVLCCIVY